MFICGNVWYLTLQKRSVFILPESDECTQSTRKVSTSDNILLTYLVQLFNHELIGISDKYIRSGGIYSQNVAGPQIAMETKHG